PSRRVRPVDGGGVQILDGPEEEDPGDTPLLVSGLNRDRAHVVSRMSGPLVDALHGLRVSGRAQAESHPGLRIPPRIPAVQLLATLDGAVGVVSLLELLWGDPNHPPMDVHELRHELLLFGVEAIYLRRQRCFKMWGHLHRPPRGPDGMGQTA